jgi:hypothetical protein
LDVIYPHVFYLKHNISETGFCLQNIELNHIETKILHINSALLVYPEVEATVSSRENGKCLPGYMV